MFTHIIFEVGAGAAQQEDACALGVAVLAGQVQGRVPCLGERREKGGQVSDTALRRPAPSRPHGGATLTEDRSELMFSAP